MPYYVGLDVFQKTTAICVVDEQGTRLWRGVCVTDPGAISARISKYAGAGAKVGIETGAMTPWLVHGLRSAGLNVQCLDARKVKAALQMQLNKTDENDAVCGPRVIAGRDRAVDSVAIRAINDEGRSVPRG